MEAIDYAKILLAPKKNSEFVWDFYDPFQGSVDTYKGSPQKK